MTSVDKALDTLLLLARQQPMGVRDIARELQLSPPTVYRLLSTLASHGLVQQSPGRRDYRLGWACLSLAKAALADVDLVQIGAEVARGLRDKTRETVTIQVAAGRDHVCILEVEGLDEIRRRVGVGRRMPLHAGASGRVILAYMPREEIDAYIAHGLEQVTQSTVVDPERLEELLEQTRAVGFAVTRSESVSGAVGISAPIFGPGQRIEGSISVSGPASRLTPETVNEVTPHVVEAARQLSQKLGHSQYVPRTTTAARPALVREGTKS